MFDSDITASSKFKCEGHGDQILTHVIKEEVLRVSKLLSHQSRNHTKVITLPTLLTVLQTRLLLGHGAGRRNGRDGPVASKNLLSVLSAQAACGRRSFQTPRFCLSTHQNATEHLSQIKEPKAAKGKQLVSAFLFCQQTLFARAYQGCHHVIWRTLKAATTLRFGSVSLSRRAEEFPSGEKPK